MRGQSRKRLLLQKRDVDLLIALWDNPLTIQETTRRGFFPSHGSAARRVAKLRSTGLVFTVGTNEKPAKRGRPQNAYKTDKGVFIEVFEDPEVKEWLQEMGFDRLELESKLHLC